MSNDLEHQSAELLFWSWGHEIRGKTATIKDLVFLIRKLLSDSEPDRDQVISLLDKIVQIGEKLEATISSPREVAEIPLHELIESCIKRWETTGANNPATFHPALHSSQPYIRANSEWLARVLDIIIENAVDAMSQSSNRSIHIGTDVDESSVTITVQDTGGGIDQQYHAEVFQKPLEFPGGRGRGLYIAGLVMKIYGGKIEIAETLSTGTAIAIWLPLYTGATSNA